MHALLVHPDVQFAFWSFVKIFVILNGVLGIVSYMILAERKLAGRMQGRYGPNRVGPAGLLQPLADVLKLFLKEEFIPAEANTIVYHIAPMLAVVPAPVSFSGIPLGPNFFVTHIHGGFVFFFAVCSLGV